MTATDHDTARAGQGDVPACPSPWLLRLVPGADRARDEAGSVLSGPSRAVARERLGDGPVGWAAETALRMTKHVIETVPEYGGGPGPFLTLRRSVESAVLAALLGLVDGIHPDADMVPAEAVEGNAELARRGVPLDRVLRGVRIGHASLHRALMDALDTEPEPVRAAESHRVSELLFAYADVHASRMAEEYIAERDRWQTGTAAARRRIVDDILDGRAVDPRPAGRVLGYDLSRHHLALLITADDPATSPDALYRAAVSAAAALGGSGLLTLPSGSAELWAWVAVADRSAESVPDVRRGVRVALGPPARGVDGFRRSHHGAREARRLAGDSRVTRYADVRVRSLITADEQRARWFAAETLGALSAAEDRAAELRETLRVYLACGRSPQSAAELLHVSRNTVTYRVKRAEELLGHPLTGDLLELRLALEVAATPEAPGTTGPGILG